MDEPFPLGDAIYVLKEGRRLGPFWVEDLLDGLESGDFTEDDICLREGENECERLRDLLDWEEAIDRPETVETEDLDDFDEEEEDAAPVERSPEKRQHSDRLLYSGHPSVLTYPISLLALVGGVTGGVWLYRVDPNLTLAGLGLAVAGLIRLSLVRYTHDYLIRARRIETITGLVARSSREVRIEDIRSINVTCRGLTGILGVGTVDFLTSGDTPEVSFRRVWAARSIKSLVRRLQDTN